MAIVEDEVKYIGFFGLWYRMGLFIKIIQEVSFGLWYYVRLFIKIIQEVDFGENKNY